MLDILYDMIYFCFLFSSGVFMASFFVAVWVYEPMLKDLDREDISSSEAESSEEEEEPFDRRYLELIDKYDTVMECTDEELAALGRKYVTMESPMGDILMYYDGEHFVYHARTSEIPYRFLDTVCRNFVLENRCVRLYCNMEKDVEEIKLEIKTLAAAEVAKAEEAEAKEAEEGKVEAKVENDSVFASFKSYNTKSAAGGISVPASRINTKNEDEDIVLKERINSYRYGGKIYEFEEGLEKSNDEEKKIDFATFKEMMENKKLV